MILTFTFVGQKSYAQCTNPLSRPNDTYTVQGWPPQCNGGNNGFIRISGIGSTVGAYTNGPYTARILTAIGGTAIATYPIPAGSTVFDIPGLSAGNYVVDIADQCSGTSSDKAVTVAATIAPSYTLKPSTHPYAGFFDRKTVVTCGDTYSYRVLLNPVALTGQTITATFTNNLGVTITGSVTTVRTQSYAPGQSREIDVDLPLAFFNGLPLTLTTASDMCGNTQSMSIPYPGSGPLQMATTVVAANKPAQSLINPCLTGYDVTRSRLRGTNPITATIEVTGGGVAYDIDNVAIPNFSGNVDYAFVHTDNGTSYVDLGTKLFGKLKYGTSYTINYTDACGLTSSEVVNLTPPAKGVTSASCISTANYFGSIGGPFIDNTAIIRMTLPSTTAIQVAPYTFTINSGPTTWSSNLGLNPVSTTISYPITYTFASRPADGHFYIGEHLPPGLYNITYSDACGNTNTVNYTLGSTCTVPSTTAKIFNYCNSATTVDFTYRIVNGALGRQSQWISVYNAAGTTLLQSKKQDTYNDAIFTGLAPGTYVVRFGGKSSTNTNATSYSMPDVPKLASGHIYEEVVVVPALVPLSFASITTCNGTATGVGSGGVAPLTYTLLNPTGTTVLQPAQATGVFSGLTEGVEYRMRVIDNCGRTFNQNFTVGAFISAPTIGTVVQPTCASANNSVQLTNLPSGNWTITDSNGGGTTAGTGTSIILNNIATGAHTFTVTVVGGCTSPASINVTINPMPVVPAVPTVGVGAITQPTCTTPTGSVILTNLPATGTYTITNTNGGATYSGLSGTSTNISGLTAGTHNFTVTNADACSSVTASADVVINPVAGTPVVTINNPAAVCSGSSVDLTLPAVTAGSTPGLVYTYFRDALGTITLANPNAVTVADIYYIKGTNGACSDIKPVMVTINPQPTTPVVTPAGPLTICPSSNVVLSSTTATSYQWYKGGVQIPGETNQTYVATANGTYTVVVKDANCFSNPSNGITITVQDIIPPVVTGTVVTNLQGCAASSAPAAVTTAAALEALGFSISDNCTVDAALTITSTDVVAGACPIVVTRTYHIKDASNNNTDIVQTININDTTKPTVTGTITTTTVEGCTAASAPAAAITVAALEAMGLAISDNCTTDANLVVSSVDVVTGTCPIVITRTYKITDACGNFETVVQTININDTTKPIITGTIATTTIEGCSVANAPAAATTVVALEAMGIAISDNCTTDANLIVTSSDAVTGTCPLVITRTYRITDACGNFQTVSHTININDTTKPIITGTIATTTIEGCSVASAPAAASTVAALEAMGIAISDNCTTDANLVVTNASVVNGANPIVITRTYTITDACGNAQSIVQIINIKDTTPPIAPNLADATVGECSGTPVVPTTTDNCSGTIIATTNTVFPITKQGTTVVTWTFVDEAGNLTTVDQNVIVKDTTKPVKPVLADVISECTVTLTPPVTIDNCAGTITGTTNTIFPITTQGTTLVTWTFTDGNGNTETATQRVTLINIAAPVVTVTAQPTCTVATGSINIAAVAGATYSVDGGAYTSNTTYNLAPGVHTITAKSTGGCISDITRVTINPQPPLPVANISYNPSEYQAVGTAAVIQTGQTGGTYTASPTGLSINPTTGQIDLAASVPNQTYTVTYTFSNGTCTSTATTTVKINSRPATIGYANPAYCAKGTVTIIRTGPQGGTYTASPSGLVINAATGEVNLGTSRAGSYTVTYTYQDGTITASATTTITVNALPVLTLTSDIPSGNTISLGDMVTLTATGGVTYTWTGDDIQSGQGTSVIKVRPRQGTTYTVTATNANGCSETMQITINLVADRKIIPNNVITPNGDGKNDTWVVKNLDYYPNNTVTIYDRAGRKIYSVKGYRNDWDGSYNGQPLAEDAYIYVIDSGKGIGLIRGTINIIRDQR